MDWKDIPNTQWYGERGIVNAVVTYINHKNRLERLKKFLKAIKWGSNNKPGWICDVSDFKIIVELGLSEFGDPDLIIVCEVKNEGRYCVFIEAKVCQYEKSMCNNEEGMKKKRFNSSINGQLSLKYRFATALNNWNENDNQALSEPEYIYQSYKKDLNDDSRCSPRKIVKPKIINNILEPLGLRNLDKDRFYFVAWTWDNDDHVFFNDQEIDDNKGMPLFCGTDSANIKMRLGWLGYKNLEDALGLDCYDEYMTARKTMIDTNEPDNNNEYYIANRIEHKNLKDFDGDIINLSNKIATIFEGNTALKTEKLDGSYSITYKNRVVAKIIPQNEYSFVGFRMYLKEILWTRKSSYKHKLTVIKLKGEFYEGIKIMINEPDIKMEDVTIFINECIGLIDTIDM